LELKRINKYLSEIGYCSRRAADKLIEAGRVTINGQIPEMGTKIVAGDMVRVDGELMEKPDKPSEGLIFMTSDGDIVNKILRSRNNHEKVYEVRVNKPITKQFIEQMSKGIPILDTVTDPCKVEQIDRFYFKITLTQGLNRQIRKMCAYLNYEVYKLKRIKIMNIELDVPYGEWRYLNTEEMIEIHRLVKDSHKTFDAEM
jgi:23S rRNA pseudouridine2604 synthase